MEQNKFIETTKQENVIYLVKDLDGLSVLRLNPQQLDDLVMRIQNRYFDTPLAAEVFHSVESCLSVGSMKIIETIYV